MSDVDPELEFAEIFTAIDKSGNGLISFDELKDFMIEIGEFDPEIGKGDEFVEKIITESDVD